MENGHPMYSVAKDGQQGAGVPACGICLPASSGCALEGHMRSHQLFQGSKLRLHAGLSSAAIKTQEAQGMVRASPDDRSCLLMTMQLQCGCVNTR